MDGSYELMEASVVQAGRESDVVTVRFQPALPDMRRPFSGIVKSQVGIAVNGQVGLATGEVTAQWSSDYKTAQIDVIPSAPWWVRDRQMQSRLAYEEEGVQIQIEMKGLGDNPNFHPKFPRPKFASAQINYPSYKILGRSFCLACPLRPFDASVWEG